MFSVSFKSMATSFTRIRVLSGFDSESMELTISDKLLYTKFPDKPNNEMIMMVSRITGISIFIRFISSKLSISFVFDVTIDEF